MREISLPVSVGLNKDDSNELALIFNEVVSNRDMEINNAPSRAEFEQIAKHCKPVLWSIISKWINPGIAGVNSIRFKRHLILVRRAHNLTFGWESILFMLTEAIQDAYPGRQVLWSRHCLDEESDKDAEVGRAIEVIDSWQKLEFTMPTSNTETTPRWSVVA